MTDIMKKFVSQFNSQTSQVSQGYPPSLNTNKATNNKVTCISSDEEEISNFIESEFDKKSELQNGAVQPKRKRGRPPKNPPTSISFR